MTPVEGEAGGGGGGCAAAAAASLTDGDSSGRGGLNLAELVVQAGRLMMTVWRSVCWGSCSPVSDVIGTSSALVTVFVSCWRDKHMAGEHVTSLTCLSVC